MQPLPPDTVQQLLESPSVTPATRRALRHRLETSWPAPQFFTEPEVTLLRAVCARLIPQPERETPLDIAPSIDQRLSEGKTDGWRYETLPPDGEVYRSGLRGIDESARLRFGQPFQRLSSLEQDAILGAIQRGEAPGETWKILPATRFFEELLAEVVEVYFSHPVAQQEIGYLGFADAAGWQRVGFV